MTVQLHRTGAVAVTEHAAVHLRTQLAHLTTLVLGRQRRRQLIQRFDLLGNLEILVRDRSIGDFRINLRHRKVLVPQQRGDRFHAHTPVHGLGREGMPQLMRMDVTDTSGAGHPLERPLDANGVDTPTVLGEQQVATQPRRALGEPLVDQLLQLRVQRHVPIGAHLAHRNP
jgi:hypothetical protein